MSLINSPEFFINMKSIPQKGDRDYEAFVRYELEKLEYGVTVNGVYITNWLYWHLNHWQAFIPDIDPRTGQVKDRFLHPKLRDNEWIVAEGLKDAIEQKKGIVIVGGRRIAKTSMVASWLALNATIHEGSQNVIVGNNKGDIRNITTQMDKGLGALSDFLRIPTILNNWEKEVELGWKEKSAGGKRDSWSSIYIRNTEEGTKTEVLAGLTPKSLVYDEIGKAPTREVFTAGLPAFESPYGWRCVPILTGTGGDFTRGKDAEEIFHNPDRFNLLALDVEGENRKTGLFIPGNYATTFPKKQTTLSMYLGKEQGSELDDIIFYETDFETSNKEIDNKLELALKANDQKEYLKTKMYIPRTVDECFISNVDENPFPVEQLKTHLDFLTRIDKKPLYVKLIRNANNSSRIDWVEVNNKPVMEYPVKKDTIKKAPVVIYEEPMLDPPAFLYIAGGDPYNQSQSSTSPSLGTIYIFKRTYDPVSGTYQNRIVASYSARPDDMKEWHETAEMMLEMYHATCMIENIGTNFIQYMENRNKGYLLADGYNLTKEISPNSSAMMGKTKGLPATSSVQNHYRNLIIQYLKEEIVVGINPETLEPITMMGLTRIDDPMLLTELINFRETEFKKGGGNKKKGNFDRYVAFGHVITYNEYLEKISPRIKTVEVETKKKETTVRSPFIISKKENTYSPVRNPFL